MTFEDKVMVLPPEGRIATRHRFIFSFFRPKYRATIHGKTVASTTLVDLINQCASAEN
jgi:hypothetical protein